MLQAKERLVSLQEGGERRSQMLVQVLATLGVTWDELVTPAPAPAPPKEGQEKEQEQEQEQEKEASPPPPSWAILTKEEQCQLTVIEERSKVSFNDILTMMTKKKVRKERKKRPASRGVTGPLPSPGEVLEPSDLMAMKVHAVWRT